VKALVVNALGRGFELEDADIAAPMGREVLVNVQASGLCHTDLLFATHNFVPTPAVLGHEVAGIVAAVGPDVALLRVGDHVVGSLVQSCGACARCQSARSFQCTHPESRLRRPSDAPPLRSTCSAAAEAALFARFLTTSGRSDFSIALIVGYGLRPSRQRPGHDWRGRRWRSPGSRAKGFCACQGLRRRGVGMCLAKSTPAVWPSVGRKTSAPRTCLTPLNTSPAPSPVNASRLPSRASRASLGAGAVRYSFTVTDFHRLPFAGLPAHPSTASPTTKLPTQQDVAD